jgi:hypothetical protein
MPSTLVFVFALETLGVEGWVIEFCGSSNPAFGSFMKIFEGWRTALSKKESHSL